MGEIWKPFPKQERVLTITPDQAFEILFGGSRGPGKTEAGIVWLLGDEIDDEGHLYIHHPRYRALVLRRDYDDLSDWIDKAGYMYQRYGAKIVGLPAVIKWPSGAKFRLGHLKNRKSYEKYLGHEYQRQLVEELTQIGEEKHYVNILGSCRSTISVLRPQVFSTTNPPGIGHLWVKNRFVTPAPPNTFFKGEDGRGRIYVPATIDDNPELINKDPGYLAYLDGLKLTDPELYEAWRHGSWEVMSGQYFRTFKARTHIVEPFEPLDTLAMYGGVDWGRRNPFCFLAVALEKVDYVDDKGRDFKFNRVWIYKELYGAEKSPKEWAEEMKRVVNLNQFQFTMADPKMFHRLDDGSRSIASHFQEEGVSLLSANNDRLAGWEAVKNWMSMAPDGLPYLMISELCVNLIRTIPGQVHDETNVEDLDTKAEDHAVDALRYVLIHLDWIDANVGVVPRIKLEPEGKKYVPVLDIRKFK